MRGRVALRAAHSVAQTPPPPDVATEITEIAEPDKRWKRLGRNRLIALGALVPILLLLTAFAVDRAVHTGKVLRGVVVAGEPLGGMKPSAAEQALVELDAVLRIQPLTVTIDGRSFDIDPEKVSLRLDIQVTLDHAMRAGREGHIGAQLWFWLSRIGGRHAIAATTTFERAALGASLARIAKEAIADPPFEGAVAVEHGVPVAKPPHAGRVIDEPAAAEAIAQAFPARDRAPLELPIVERQPQRDARAVSDAVTRAKRLLAGAVTLSAELPKEPEETKSDAKPEDRIRHFAFDTALLGSALRSRPGIGNTVELYFEPQALEPVLKQARAELESPPRIARFAISPNDDVSIVESRPARIIQPARVAAQLFEIASSGARQGELPVDIGKAPEFTTEQARALGIKGLVSQFTTSHPCCRPRVHNIHRMADLIDGVILKPGERFSINELVGERTKRNGFYEAPTIVRGKMKDTFGGGASQFATTFFNAFFHGGYEIIERQPHSYYFPRYPMGHEATLSYPKPDVIVRNDTEAGLLIRCVYTDTSISVRLYGDNGGRKITRELSAPRELTSPKVEFLADRSLSPGRKKVKDSGQQGWSVIVARIITFPDGSEKRERRKVTYSPRPRIVRVHPCRIPRGEKGYTGEPCPEIEGDDDDDDDDSEPLGPHELESAKPVDPELTPEG